MRSWKDAMCTLIGGGLLVLGAVYFHYTGPLPSPINGRMGPNESPAQLYPTCDWFPNGVDGKPCLDNDEFVRSGKLIFHRPKD